MKTTITPFGTNESKKAQVEQMFDDIAGRYDFLNHLLSGGIDILWRRKAINLLKINKIKILLDIATGTADFAIEAARLRPKEIIGIDISEGMLAVGRQKIKRKALEDKITLLRADSEALPFEDNFVDAVTVGFGVRNFENLEKGLSEILRVLKQGGVAVILEPSIPTRFPTKQLYSFYFTTILPIVGRLVSNDSAAYNYLPESVLAFPGGNDFVDICKKVGFKRAEWKPLTFGVCALYILEK